MDILFYCSGGGSDYGDGGRVSGGGDSGSGSGWL